MGLIKLTDKEINFTPTRDSYIVCTTIENGEEVVRRVPVYAFEDILGSSYVPISIDSFTSSLTIAELGSTITSPITLTYKCNKKPKSLKLDGNTVEVQGENGSILLQGHSISSNKTWNLVATDDKEKTSSKSVSLSFVNRVYYGASTLPSSVNDTFLRGLSNVLSNSRSRKITVNSTASTYIWYCYPARYGNATFKVGGFDGGFELYNTINHTNSSGYSESYYVYKSDNSSLGNTVVEIS